MSTFGRPGRQNHGQRAITFMDAASPFYQYSMMSMCGIPRLRLLGTAADWQLLLTSARQLAKSFAAHLGSYFKHLLPVLTKIADQADPAMPIDNDFWASIYKRASASGGTRVTGWATAFVHYLKNPNGELVLKDPRFADWTQAGASPFDGILHDHFPMHLSTVPFEWEYLRTKRPMKLVGGMLGIDVEDGFVTPMLSYAVVHAAK